MGLLPSYSCEITSWLWNDPLLIGVDMTTKVQNKNCSTNANKMWQVIATHRYKTIVNNNCRRMTMWQYFV